ncbi:hypothetical protein N8000_05295 [Rhodospirillales bacterium]|nr:hypothetical protein [Rhodospirillales bacterium]
MLDQSLIDDIVAGTLDGTLSNEVESAFVAQASVYEDEFQNVWSEVNHCYLTVFDAFDRGELPHWESYFDIDTMEQMGFSAAQLAQWEKNGRVSDEEYKLFLRNWVDIAFGENTDLRYALAVLHPLKHSDGRECIALLSMGECGQGGWEFEDVFLGFFKSKQDALAHVKSNCGLIDIYNKEELEQYLNEVVPQK